MAPTLHATTSSQTRLPDKPVRRIAQVIWVLLVLLNLLFYAHVLLREYDRWLTSEVNQDIHLELVPDSVYGVRDEFETELRDDGTLLVTSVSEYASEQGLQVGDIILNRNWLQGSQDMPIVLQVQSEDGDTQEVILVASNRTDGYIFTWASEEAQAAGINEGDIITGDYVPWEGPIGSEITFLIIPEGETEPQPVTLTRKHWLPSYLAFSLKEIGFSADTAYVLMVARTVVIIVFAYALALLIAIKRSDDWMALAFAWVITVAPKLVIPESYLPRMYPGANYDANVFIVVVGALAILTIILFPTGRLYPRWSALLPAGWVVVSLLPLSIVENTVIPASIWFLIVVGVVWYRYLHHFSPAQKQQTKWVGFAFACIGLSQLIFVPSSVYLADANPDLNLIYEVIFEYAVNAILIILAMIMVLFAILRNRLWDIDLVINRSLVYGAVALVGIGLFFVALYGLQVIIGQTQPLIALAIAGGVSAAAFHPLRGRVQHLVDRYIYRFRFDLHELHAAHHRPQVTNPGALTGQHLGDYEVLDVIGKGGMGEIYKGFGNGQIVAIKTMLPEIAREHELRVRFQREAEAGMQLNHPNIAGVYASGEHEGTPYLVMEYIDGQDLSEVLKGQGPLDEETATYIMRDICSGLSAAHKLGFVHRDIKPSNIMLRKNGDAVMMDFGVTKITGATRSLTGTGAVGTIDYMAPEQIMASREVDHRADIYALGVVLYEMLTGERLFKGELAQVMFAHLQQPPPDPRDTNGEIPDYMADVVLKALEKKPEDRFQTVEEVMALLLSYA